MRDLGDEKAAHEPDQYCKSNAQELFPPYDPVLSGKPRATILLELTTTMPCDTAAGMVRM